MKKVGKSKEKSTKSANTFCRNKPNSPNVQMNVTNLTTMNCTIFNSLTVVKNKPNQTQFKANSNPIPERPEMNLSTYFTSKYNNKTAFRRKKTNPIQTQNKPNSERSASPACPEPAEGSIASCPELVEGSKHVLSSTEGAEGSSNLSSYVAVGEPIVERLNFESYNDLDPTDPASNRIFLAWLDGFDNPAINGSIIGHVSPPFAKHTIVHGGNQSIPFAYDNGVGKSEVTLTLTNTRDWTLNGVNTLTIWFRGEAGNAAENLYVVLNGSAVVNHDNPNAAQAAYWTAWNIDLQVFADQGVNLANVNSITLGLGNRNNPVAGGAGIMYFDYIRLYPPEPLSRDLTVK